MLELRDVRVAYRRVEVLHGVDLCIAAGEVVGILGPNGAGKTSLLRAIFGLVRAQEGRIVFDGRSIDGLAPEAIARRGLALVPEGRQIFKSLTVAENLKLASRSRRLGEQRMEGILERFPILRTRAAQRADRLSGGEQQQLALARALLGDPKLLVLDEPSLGLAPKTIDTVYDILQGLRESGVTILLVEQNAARTIQFSDRCVVLSSGHICAEGSREHLRCQPALLGAYLGEQP